MNQMSTVMRNQLVAAGYTSFAGRTNNQLLLNPIIKLAFSMCVDKNCFVETALDGWGTSADSLVPLVSKWHYAYGSTPGETPIPFDTAGARSLLWTNGWKYDSAGNGVSETSTQCPLYGYVDGILTPLEFRFYTVNNDLMFIEGATLIADWAAQAGLKLNLTIKTTSQMNLIWYAADYDAWLWDWTFEPESDPSIDVMSVLTTMEIGTWSDVYWSYSAYDALYNEFIRQMDPGSRKLLLDEMQRMAYLHSGCWPVAYVDELYAAQSVAPASWQNFGDWTKHFTLTPDSGYPWLFLQIYPANNPPPEISGLAAFREIYVNTPLGLTASATDDSEMEYLWNFGDGSQAVRVASPNPNQVVTFEVDKMYTSAGTFTAYLRVSDGIDTVYSGPIVMSVAIASFALSLMTGWNLVTVPLTCHNYKASTLGLSFGDVVVRWHPGGWYEPAYVVGISPSTMDFKILDGEAFWIWTAFSKTLNLKGDYPTGAKNVTVAVPPGGGWAMIGLTSLKTTWNASDIPGMFSGGSVMAVVAYNPGYGYMVYYALLPFTDFPLTPGQGLWIYCSASGTLSYSA